jgi:hypothetical protein
MGYRSEVAFVVPESAPRFEEVENCFEDVIERDGCRLYYATWIKWYEDYPIVQAVTDYLVSLEDDGKSEDYLFIRLGEDYNDIEEEGEFWDNPFDLGWARKININFG